MSEPKMPGIENFVPRCQACAAEVPQKRRNRKFGHACSNECAKKIRAWKRHLTEMSVCVTCYHPSTPAQRASYLAWRRSTGLLYDSAGKPPVKRLQALSEALGEAVAMLKAATPDLMTVDEREKKIKKFQKLLDVPAVKRGKLAANVEAKAETPTEPNTKGEG